MAYQAAVPAPRHKAEKDPHHWADTPENFVSSGPMRLLSWQHNQRLEWEANPFYNGAHKVGIQKLVQLIGAPAVGWFNSWLNKEIDYIPILQPQELEQVINDNELAQYLHSFNNFQIQYLSFDCLRPPFDNLLLRQALSHAVDREPFCSKVMLGTRVPAFSMLPPDFPAYNPELKSIQEFNVEKAHALFCLVIPSFVFAILLQIIFSVWLGWLPTGGWSSPRHWIMPVLANSLAPILVLQRYTRASMTDAMRANYVRTARAKGLSRKRIMFVHVFKNALTPLLTVGGPLAAGLVVGSFFVESIFRIPGIGFYFVTAISARDYPMIMATTLVWTLIISLAYLITDFLYALADPRVTLVKEE